MEHARHSPETTRRDDRGPRKGLWPAALARRSTAVALLMAIALAHGLIYAFGVPLWQAPDEPMLFEYVALTAELGRIPAKADRSLVLERGLIASLNRNDFWRYRGSPAPDPLPADLVALREAIFMPRQVGGDPPVYFALAALPLRLAAGWSIEAQAYLLRALNALLLPLGVACAYGAARGLLADAEGPAAATIGVAAAALVALQPMYTHIGTIVSNDGLANCLGALLTLLVVRAVREGLPGRTVALVAVLAAVAMQTKRTTLPFGLIAAGLACAWLGRLALRGGPGAGRRRALAIGALVGAPLAGLALVASQLGWGEAARWYDARSLMPAARAAAGGGYALVLEPGQEAIQVLPDVATARLRNGAVRAGARVWGEGPVSGRLVIYTGERRTEFAFTAAQMSTASLSAAVPTSTSTVRIGIVADSGRLYASDIWLEGVGVPGRMLSNGDLARPAFRPDSALQPLLGYLRAEEVLWALQSGGWAIDFGEWRRWLFFSFWGHFGWMDVAFVRDSWWEPALAVMTGVGLAGAAWALARGRQARRAPVALLVTLLALACVPVLIQTFLDPRIIQQGRYLFPALAALAGLMALGQATLVPRRARDIWLAGWLAFWLTHAGGALLAVTHFYYG